MPRTSRATLVERAPSLTAELQAARDAVKRLEAERLTAWRKLAATITHGQIATLYSMEGSQVATSTVSVALKRSRDGHR